jgi:hypothetical protein
MTVAHKWWLLCWYESKKFCSREASQVGNVIILLVFSFHPLSDFSLKNISNPRILDFLQRSFPPGTPHLHFKRQRPRRYTCSTQPLQVLLQRLKSSGVHGNSCINANFHVSEIDQTVLSFAEFSKKSPEGVCACEVLAVLAPTALPRNDKRGRWNSHAQLDALYPVSDAWIG